MLDIIPAMNRHFNNFGWLKTYWLFSFSSYYDPQNMGHGTLRVFNDDVVAPGSGFPTHPHEEMEIISIILSGEMVHKDTMGNEAVIRAGDVQRMTAGTGLQHSEMNMADAPVHFLQIWIRPVQKKLKPSYDQKNFDPRCWHNRLARLASAEQGLDVVKLNTDATLFRASLDAGTIINYRPKEERKTFIYLLDGTLVVNEKIMNKSDQARISGIEQLLIQASSAADFLLLDIPAERQL